MRAKFAACPSEASGGTGCWPFRRRMYAARIVGIFAVGRIAGWSAHIMEQHGDNRLIRPESEYTGPVGKRYIPIAER